MDHYSIGNVSSVIHFIEAHLTEKIDLDIVANAVNYSKFHLHRMFTNTVGMTLHDYVQRRQRTEAAKLLVFSEKPIIEIALIAGYESQQAFTTAFKAMYKPDPNQFRERKEFYPLQLEYMLKQDPSDVATIKNILIRNITFATIEDIPAWMDLVHLVIDGYSCLVESEYLEKLKRHISEKLALIIKDNDTIIGVSVFSYITGNIEFLGVHPQYKQQGIRYCTCYWVQLWKPEFHPTKSHISYLCEFYFGCFIDHIYRFLN